MPRGRFSSTGDVIELILADGRFAYLQDCGVVSGRRVARFLPGLYATARAGSELRSVVNAPCLYRACCDTRSLLAEGYAGVVAREPVPPDEQGPPDLIIQAIDEDRQDWWVRLSGGEEITVREYEETYPAQDVLRLARMTDQPSPPLLRERVATRWVPGETLPRAETDVVRVPLADRLRPILEPRTRYISYFKSEELANEYIVQMGAAGRFTPLAEQVGEEEWEVNLDTTEEFEPKLARVAERLTRRLGGSYDGDIDVSQ